ncbi:MAG: alpha/beta fold hydrolase [Sporolactobacillus sp.]
MPFFKTQSTTIHYTYLKGLPDDPTLVFIHGLGEDQHVWEPLLRRLNPAFGWLIYDLPAHGRHAHEIPALNFPNCIQELKDLLDYLHLDSVHLIGDRFGAYLALLFANLQPTYIRSLLLISFPFAMGDPEYKHDILVREQLLHVDRKLFERKLLIDGLHTLTLSHARLILQALRRVATQSLITPLYEMHDQFRELDNGFEQLFSQIRQPTLFLQGEYDPTYPATLATLLIHYSSISQLMIIPDAALFIHLDQPAAIVSQIAQFLMGKLFPVAPLHPINETTALLNTIVSKMSQTPTQDGRKLTMQLMQEKPLVFWNGFEIDGKWTQRSAREILLYLMMNGGTAKRDSLIDTFFPEGDLDQARNQLRVQLSHLNRQFTKQPVAPLHNLLLISRDSVALNSDFHCDLVDYMNGIEQLLWSTAKLHERCDIFLDYLTDYRINWISSFHHPWSHDLIKKVKSNLSHMLISLLAALRETDDAEMMRRLLIAGKKVEPYRGFVKEWTVVTKNMKK